MTNVTHARVQYETTLYTVVHKKTGHYVMSGFYGPRRTFCFYTLSVILYYCWCNCWYWCWQCGQTFPTQWLLSIAYPTVALGPHVWLYCRTQPVQLRNTSLRYKWYSAQPNSLCVLYRSSPGRVASSSSQNFDPVIGIVAQNLMTLSQNHRWKFYDDSLTL